ncbi:hypothetical protein PHMEG_0009275 [Phytophthora megakarya]|uniref:Uncharacterized protein n=1 Tax=Phytophthora megakarya TaxID=4795 RepID=A0A225WGM1_9STRA|nr:hypothetical protein PHMEG_0009275 [Phytophthora megakarya]
MGGNLSVVCGLTPSDSDRDPQLSKDFARCGLTPSDSDRDPQLSKDFARDVDQVTSSRGRSQSSATDSSVASILSNSEKLVPDAFLPKDIQVLSQRRQRQPSSKSSSRVSSSSSRGLGTVRVVRNDVPASVSKTFNFGIKTASSSFGYSDDEPTTNRLAVQELRVK